MERRAELEAEARAAEAENRTAQAWLLRSRLQKGDFQEGDKIVVIFETNPSAQDTVTVRQGKVIQVKPMPELSLDGVLRSELTDTLRYYLSRYLKNPAIRATPLLPIAVLGNVKTPGYYYMTADVVLRDAIMKAGGPEIDADFDRITIKRGRDVIWNADDVQVALNDGLSLDRLHLRSGDEVWIPPKKRFPVSTLVSIASATAAMLLTVMQLQR
jgi:protein involved in polysaccharide export with SLBB domain